jgi:hypothetical protein
MVWARLVVHRPDDRARAGVIAAYGVVNASAGLRAAWGVSPDLVAEIRAALVGGGAAAAAHLVPAHVVDDVALPTADPVVAGAHAGRIGATEVAVPAFDIASVGDRVAWARQVLAARR